MYMRYNKTVGIVICNYNKHEYLMKCIDSILQSSVNYYDVYVVDNHSEDNSVAIVKQKYGDSLRVIQNRENLGGSGGFNTGIREVLRGNYQYLMCVDNDIVMEPDNIERLYNFMEINTDVGMAGSKICRMNEPNRLQEMGADINFNTCVVEPHFKNYIDNDDLPAVQYCDYVPACSLLMRTEIVHEIGLMPEENFIYWDDMEWGYRVRLAGYKVVALREAKVYHAMGTNSDSTYFPTYYFWRNRLRFFMKYTPLHKREFMAETLLENLFQTLYGCFYKGKANQLNVVMYAYDDALHGNLGKASGYKILDRDSIEDRISEVLKNSKKIYVEFNGDYKLLQVLVQKTVLLNKLDDILIVEPDVSEGCILKKQQEACKILSALPHKAMDEGNLVLCMCSHVSLIQDIDRRKVYIDGYQNILQNENDINHFRNYEYNKKLFIKIQKQLFLNACNG